MNIVTPQEFYPKEGFPELTESCVKVHPEPVLGGGREQNLNLRQQ
jgi:hypothetical protein